jgi:hypothetical protein
MSEFHWNGVNDYLDFYAQKHGSPLSEEQIITLKHEYRKKYLAYKKKVYRARQKSLSFSVSKKDYILLQSLAKEQGLKIRDYLFVKLFAKGDNHKVKKVLLPKVLELIDDVECSIYEKSALHLPKVLNILMQIKNLIL